jgi:hypothetical protein
MEITTYIGHSTIIAALTDGVGEDDPIKFVMDLDAAMADEGFTENLLLALAQSYEKEYTAYEEHWHGAILESTFADASAAPKQLDKMRSGLDEVSSKRNKLSQITSLLKSLDE